MDFSTRYVKLNTAQKQAVDTTEGPVMVIAGPGTGKTELLSMRAANILKKTDTLPENILCLTFTESGASAIRERLSSIIGKDAFKVATHTFHSFGAEIMNQYAEYFYNGAQFRAADDLSSYELLRAIFDDLDHSSPLGSKMNGEYTYLSDTITTISELKKSGLTSDELLTVLDANDKVIDRSEPILSTLFASRLQKKTIDQLAPVIEQLEPYDEAPFHGIMPLSQLLKESLTHALEHAQTDNSTKPLTAWRNHWMKKDDQGIFVLKARDHQAKLRAVSSIYYQYLLRMQESELYDFDDMILRVVHALEVFPELRFNLQEKYQYIMVDEFQDTNLAQMRILYNLTNNEVNQGRPNIMVVGDDDQAIYSFQGAEISNILNFRTSYEHVETIALVENYRSSAHILEAAREVITQGSDRLENVVESLDKSLIPRRSVEDSSVRLLEAASRHDEYQAIADEVKLKIEAGVMPSTIAILARRHHEIVSLLPYLNKAGIAINYERRDNVLESEPIILLEQLSEIILALHNAQHDQANALLPKLMSHPAWKFSATDIWKLSLQAYGQRKNWLELMLVTPIFQAFAEWLIELAQKVAHTPLEAVIDELIGRVDTTDDQERFISPLYHHFFSTDQLADAPANYLAYLEALRTIRAKLRDYRTDTTPTLQTFISFIDLHRRLGSAITSVRPQLELQQDAINLMTAHKSKGLEFDHVYIIGAIDSAWGERVRTRHRLIGYPENLPLAPSGDSFDERLRLFFVAMTRAREHLTISYSLLNDSNKPTLGASFLLATSMQPSVIGLSHNLEAQIAAAEQRWYEPILSVPQTTMQQLLAPTLEHYKMSITHLNNFLDVSRGGPETFLINNLLRFPQSMSPAAAYGSAIHSALQHAHAHVVATQNQRPIEDILHDFEEQLQHHHLSKSDEAIYLQKGTDTLQAFLSEKYDSFRGTQKVELNFAGQHVIVGEARLTGALDLVDIDQTAKTIIVTDYKTGKPSRHWQGKTDYEKIKLHKYKQQLMFYELLIQNSRDYHSYQVSSGVLQFVEPTRGGEIVALESQFSTQELTEFTQLMRAVWKHIITLDLPDISQYEPSYKGMLAFEQDLLSTYIDTSE